MQLLAMEQNIEMKGVLSHIDPVPGSSVLFR